MCMISVIVVVYNAEKTIIRCLESIQNQSYHDFELIIINDGSTDGTSDIINDYKNSDSRIVFKSRGNLGVAKSRQEGLDLSKGDYTIFVDADDWVEPDFLEKLVTQALNSKADMVICDMLVERANFTEYSCQKPMEMNSEIVLGQMLKELHGSLCNKLISKAAYTRTGVRFLEGLNCSEDQYVVMALLANNISLSYCNQALYHYDKTINNNSISNNWLNYDVSKRILFVKSIEKFIQNEFQHQCYDDYIGLLAYTATASPKSACPDYCKLFKEYTPHILRSRIPQFKKIICYLRLKGINIPIRWVKMIRLYIRNKNNDKKNG